MTDLRRLGKIIIWMVIVFVVTGLIASVFMLAGVSMFPPAQGVHIQMEQAVTPEKISIGHN